MPETLNSYDVLPYQCTARSDMHPSSIASTAILLGFNPPPVETCRVLELGCADATNVLASAMTLPNAQFYGVELSERQFATGQRRLQASGLRNVTLRCASILDLGEEIGQFDYIVTHGVFSWVPPPVQQGILRVCRDHLKPNGLAYISYNTRPGWNMRLTLREMLQYHTSQFENVDDQLSQMHALFDFIREYVGEAIKNTPPDTPAEPYHLFLQNESGFFNVLDDKYLFHEFLEENNLPMYFYEFMREASQCGLRYVGDMNRQANFREFHLPESAKILDKISPLHKEQYLDFLENRQFRQTLLCLAGNPRELPKDSQVVRAYHFRFEMKPHSAQPDLASSQPEKFEDKHAIVAEDLPIGKAALFYLSRQWPRYFAFNEIVAQARQLLRGDQTLDTAQLLEEEEYLAGMLMRFYAKGIMDATVYPLLHPLVASDHPTVNPLALLQAREELKHISTLACQTLTLNNPAMLKLLALMDGSRSQEELLDVLQEWADKGYIAAPATDQPKIVPTRPMLRRLLDNLLQYMAVNGGLIA